MTDRATGWLFVGIQAVLLGALILLPGRTDWATNAAVRTAADVIFWIGTALVVAAALSLGRSLNATPVPNATGALRTTGLYRFARHPIYTGVILLVIALVVRSQSFGSLLIGVVTLVFFDRKARWEEQRLAEHYPDYGDYAARTGRFMPGW